VRAGVAGKYPAAAAGRGQHLSRESAGASGVNAVRPVDELLAEHDAATDMAAGGAVKNNQLDMK
jgi:hypothetical protein